MVGVRTEGRTYYSKRDQDRRERQMKKRYQEGCPLLELYACFACSEKELKAVLRKHGEPERENPGRRAG
jgi:Mor family transcriptional regulator